MAGVSVAAVVAASVSVVTCSANAGLVAYISKLAKIRGLMVLRIVLISPRVHIALSFASEGQVAPGRGDGDREACDHVEK